jgi:hypothetical protein
MLSSFFNPFMASAVNIAFQHWKRIYYECGIPELIAMGFLFIGGIACAVRKLADIRPPKMLLLGNYFSSCPPLCILVRGTC